MNDVLFETEISVELRRVLRAAIKLNDIYHDKESRLVKSYNSGHPVKTAVIEMRAACDALTPAQRKEIAGALVR